MPWIKFQHFFDADRAGRLFDSLSTPSAFATTYGRRGDFGCRLFSEGNFVKAVVNADLDWTAALAHPVTGFAYIHTINHPFRIFSFMEASTRHVYGIRNNDGSISVYNGSGALIGTTAVGIVALNVATFYAVDCPIGNSAAFQLWIDGVLRLDEPTADTQNGGTGVCDGAIWGHETGSGGTQEARVMDIYLADGDDGDYHIMHDWRGRKQLLASDIAVDFVSGGGGNNYGNVDEVPFSSSDKNTSATPGDEDRYGIAAGGSHPTEPIRSVQVIALLSKDSGSAMAKVGMTEDGTQVYGPQVVLSTTSKAYSKLMTEKPSDASAWDETARDAISADILNDT